MKRRERRREPADDRLDPADLARALRWRYWFSMIRERNGLPGADAMSAALDVRLAGVIDEVERIRVIDEVFDDHGVLSAFLGWFARHEQVRQDFEHRYGWRPDSRLPITRRAPGEAPTGQQGAVSGDEDGTEADLGEVVDLGALDPEQERPLVVDETEVETGAIIGTGASGICPPPPDEPPSASDPVPTEVDRVDDPYAWAGTAGAPESGPAGNRHRRRLPDRRFVAMVPTRHPTNRGE